MHRNMSFYCIVIGIKIIAFKTNELFTFVALGTTKNSLQMNKFFYISISASMISTFYKVIIYAIIKNLIFIFYAFIFFFFFLIFFFIIALDRAL